VVTGCGWGCECLGVCMLFNKGVVINKFGGLQFRRFPMILGVFLRFYHKDGFISGVLNPEPSPKFARTSQWTTVVARLFLLCLQHKASQADSSPYAQRKIQTDGAVFVVHRQPIALDRFTVHDVRPPDMAGNHGNESWFLLTQCYVDSGSVRTSVVRGTRRGPKRG